MSKESPSKYFSLRTKEIDVLLLLYQHRLLTTKQVAIMIKRAESYTRDVLARLRNYGLIDRVSYKGRYYVTFLTKQGVAAVMEWKHPCEQRKIGNPAILAMSNRQSHTIAVNDVGIAFLNTARENNDECGVFSWRHEVRHQYTAPTGNGTSPPFLIADSLLRYTELLGADRARFQTFFVELDRGTIPVDELAGKANAYAKLYTYTGVDKPNATPLWQNDYLAFPTVLFVFDAKSQTVLHRRISLLQKFLSQPATTVQRTPQCTILFCLLEDLKTHGATYEYVSHTVQGENRPILGTTKK